MVQNYSKAYVEVLEVLKKFFQDELNQLPEDEIKFYKDNSDKNYKFDISHDIAIEDINISREASAILFNLFVKYLASDEEKAELRTILEENEKTTKLQARQGDTEKVANSNTSAVNIIQEIVPVAKKESVFKRISNFIKNFWGK